VEIRLEGGAVAYTYRIGKYEVTNGQYVEFLNCVDPTGANALGLYNSLMADHELGGIDFGSGAPNGIKYAIKPSYGNFPVVFVSWYDAIRFTNWLHNGKGAGDTENGAYALLGGTPTPTNAATITRNDNAIWWLPSRDEWYKAAYHKNDGVTGNYWNYPTSTDALPYSDQPPGADAPDPANTANFLANDNIANGYNDGYARTGSPAISSSFNYLTIVGAYTNSRSPYGTFDQAGNVREWNEELRAADAARGQCGGDWSNAELSARLCRGGRTPTFEDGFTGFRVATMIPEPTTVTLLALGVVGSLVIRRRFRA
jgi:formylglycine-generating enzyme required for sulfatase activity